MAQTNSESIEGGNASTWERHGQTIIASLILVAIIWVGKSVTDLTRTMGVVLNRLDTLEVSIAAMDQRFDRYQTKAEATSQRENLRLINRILEGRIEGLENKMKSRGWEG